MRHELGADLTRGGNDGWGVVVHCGVQQHRRLDPEGGEPLEQPERTDAVAIVAPGGIDQIGLGGVGEQILGEPLAERIFLDADRDIDGEARAIGPAIGRAILDRGEAVAAMSREHQGLPEWPASASPTQRFMPTSEAAALAYMAR